MYSGTYTLKDKQRDDAEALGRVMSARYAVLLREEAQAAAKSMQCNCDLDNWEPSRTTGHSHVCRIHKIAVQRGQARWHQENQQRRTKGGA